MTTEQFSRQAMSSGALEGPACVAILDHTGTATYEWDIASDRIAWSANAQGVLCGMPVEIMSLGHLYAKQVQNESELSRYDAVHGAALMDQGEGVPFEAEYALKTDNSQQPTVWVEDRGRWFAGLDGKPKRVVGTVRVINDRHQREVELRRLSQFDALTGELNRGSLTQALEAAIGEAQRYRTSFGFLLIAVDHLARLNDAFGFDVADEVIGAVAARLRVLMRGCDLMGRISGNKFGLILKNCTLEDLEIAAERFLSGIRHEVTITSSGGISVTASAGGLIFPRHGQTTQDVIARAHEALDHAKECRRGSFHAWRPSAEREGQRRANIRITDDIISALNERRVILAFEPVVSAGTRETQFWEALVRIRSANGYMLQAPEIVPAAERLGLIRLIDRRVLELAVEELAMTPDLRLSLNVSPDSAVDPDWWHSLESIMRAHPECAERMIVEITETSAIQNIDDVRGFVSRIKDHGGQIAIDDFGAGFTSFRNLRKLGVDIVKIDGAFVQNIVHSQDDRAFVHTMVDLAKRLGIRTVAEWVQDEASIAMLTEWGCDFLQGRRIGEASIKRPWASKKPAKKVLAG